MRAFRMSCVSLLAALAGGCQAAPEVQYETDRLEIAPDFDYPVCEGTLEHLDSHVTYVEDELTRWIPPGERIRFYWLTDGLDGWCSEDASGCYYPGTRVVIGDSSTVTHEIVHAVLDAEARTNLFLEEALAETFSGVGAYHKPDKGQRPDPSELLWLSPQEYKQGDLDYVVASHFMNHLYRRYGRAPVRGLASSVISGASPDELEFEFSDEFQRPFDELEADYIDGSSYHLRGLKEGLVPSIDLREPAEEITLECDSTETYGPLWDGEPGMFRSYTVRLYEPLRYELTLHGDPELELRTIDLRAQRKWGHVVDFHNPRTMDGIEIPVISGGKTVTMDFEPGRYLFVVSIPDYAPTHAVLESELIVTIGEEAPP